MLPIGNTGVGIEGVTWMVKSRGLPGGPPEGNVGVSVSVQEPEVSKSTVTGPQTNGVPEQVSVEGICWKSRRLSCQIK